MARRFRFRPPTAAARKPLGPAQDWSDADLERLATVTEPDKQAAGTFWRRHAPPAYRTLLDATSWEPEPDAAE